MSFIHSNTKKDKKNIEKLLDKVLQDNKDLIEFTDSKTEELFKDTLLKYSLKFFSTLKKKSPKITYGLQLGTTKHFCSFSIKTFVNANLKIEKGTLNSYYDKITPPAINMVACLENSGLAVYGIIKELKICINNSYNNLSQEETNA